MTIRKYSGAALFWSFTMGVVTALILAAAVFIFISNAPIPFVNKIQQVSTSVDEKLLDGKTIDPNKKLYASGQGSEQTESQVASVTAGNTDAAEVVATDRYWVNAGTFSELPDAEKYAARLPLQATTLKSSTVVKPASVSIAFASVPSTTKRLPKKFDRPWPTTAFRALSCINPTKFS